MIDSAIGKINYKLTYDLTLAFSPGGIGAAKGSIFSYDPEVLYQVSLATDNKNILKLHGYLHGLNAEHLAFFKAVCLYQGNYREWAEYSSEPALPVNYKDAF